MACKLRFYIVHCVQKKNHFCFLAELLEKVTN